MALLKWPPARPPLARYRLLEQTLAELDNFRETMLARQAEAEEAFVVRGDDGNPIYAWPFEQRHVWRTPRMPFAGRVLERATRAR